MNVTLRANNNGNIPCPELRILLSLSHRTVSGLVAWTVRAVEDLLQMQVRFARHTERLPEIIRFYGDGLGLPELGRFDDHDGYNGVFFALPGTDAHLEFTSGGHHKPPSPHPETLLVLYLGNTEAVEETSRRVGTEPVESANPYWRTHGVTFADPDGFRVVLVPE